MSKKILVVGGVGYIGSHVNLMLNRNGYQTVILDNFSRSSPSSSTPSPIYSGNMSDVLLLKQIFTEHKIDAVMHFAAFADVGESMSMQQQYYENNVAATLPLLQTMHEHGIDKIIYSSSAAVYGIPNSSLITETLPCLPINPYGVTKVMVEQLLNYFDTVHGMHFISLRYFNAAGADSTGFLRYQMRKEFNLIPLILNRLIAGNSSVTINGIDYQTPDGTCVRDYVHVEDIAQAHLISLQKLLEGSSSKCYNLGSGAGFSVRQVINSITEVTGRSIAISEGPRRAGDPPVLVANAEKARNELGWKPRAHSLSEMIVDAWKARL